MKEKDVILPFAVLMTINVSLMAMWTSIDILGNHVATLKQRVDHI